MKFLRYTDNLLSKVESALLITLLAIMILISFLQVILRNFFSTAIFWGDTFLRHLVLWVGFLGAALATREGKHINIDVLSRKLAPGAQKLTGVVTNLFSSLVCWFLMVAAIGFIRSEKAGGGTLIANLPTWIFQIIIAIGFGLMVFRFFVRALENMVDLLKKKEGA